MPHGEIRLHIPALDIVHHLWCVGCCSDPAAIHQAPTTVCLQVLDSTGRALPSASPLLQARLLVASASVRLELLSAEERLRNEPGCILEYSFTPGFPSAVSPVGNVPVWLVQAPSAVHPGVPH